MGKDRLEFFSDGVFAIAITLLVLEINIPTHEDLHHAGGLYNYLLHIWPSYLSYIMSFFVIGVYWSNHHHLFSFIIKKTDHMFNLINVFFLMTIAFLPFTTAILSEYVLDESSHNAAVTIFCIGYFLPIPMVLIILLYAKYKKRLIDPKLTSAFMKKQIIKIVISMTFMAVATAFSFQYPVVSMCMIIGSFALYFLPPDMPQYTEDN